MKTYKVHPAAMAFPRMPASEFADMKESIRTGGIKIPILVTTKGVLLDGRNRVAAAYDLKLSDKDVPTEVFKGTEEEAVAEIIARNITRRHLTDDQRVALTAKLLGKELTKQAKADRASGKAAKGKGGGEVADRIAKAAKVSQHKGRAAMETAKSPKDLDAVIAGKTKLSDAKKAAQKKTGKTPKQKPEKTLREQVQAKFLRLMESFAVNQYREVRKILRELLAEADK